MKKNISILILSFCFLPPAYSESGKSIVFKKISSSIVGIFSWKKNEDRGPANQSSQHLEGIGSVFFYGPNCLIITNAHVVAGSEVVGVSIMGENSGVQATVIAREKRLDVAILKPIQKYNCRPLQMGKLDDIEIGLDVFAIGNPLGLGQTVTSGIISATKRSIGEGLYHNYIQFDAPIFPGNSGGPLITLDGKVIGLTTLGTNKGTGIAFAMPIEVIDRMIPELLQEKKLKDRILGITVKQKQNDRILSPQDYFAGVIIGKVEKGGAAEKAGLKEDDIILLSNDKMILEINDLEMELYSYPVNSTLNLEVKRKDKLIHLKLKIQSA